MSGKAIRETLGFLAVVASLVFVGSFEGLSLRDFEFDSPRPET